MNNDRRKRLNAAKEKLLALIDYIEEIRIDEEEAFENMPESLQESERGEKMQDAVIDIQQLCDDLSAVIDDIETIVE